MERLAASTGVPYPFVREWLDVIQLAAIDGVTTADVNALGRIGITSQKSLAGQDPVVLRAHLVDMATSGHEPPTAVPTVASLDHW
ncbi:MAG: hypothetical protein JWN29_4251 [Acidimicrobiales bacterium]|nr:hypothetical protein [Acidimicrobiales bacterium]